MFALVVSMVLPGMVAFAADADTNNEEDSATTKGSVKIPTSMAPGTILTY